MTAWLRGAIMLALAVAAAPAAAHAQAADTVLLNGKAISNSVAADPQRLTDAVNQAAGQS